jgi:hypothetical protein
LFERFKETDKIIKKSKVHVMQFIFLGENKKTKDINNLI